MTLILTARLPHFIIQASDRWVTKRGAAHDVEANKSIIYRGKDGILTLAYSGIAYVGHQTTDHWLAEKICGESPHLNWTTSGSVCGPKWRTLNAALRSITQGLDETYETDLPMSIIGAGWHFNPKNQGRTIAFCVDKAGRRHPSTLRYFPRLSFGWCPRGSGASQVDERSIQRYFANTPEPLEAAAMLARAIKDVHEKQEQAGTQPTVGPEALGKR